MKSIRKDIFTLLFEWFPCLSPLIENHGFVFGGCLREMWFAAATLKTRNAMYLYFRDGGDLDLHISEEDFRKNFGFHGKNKKYFFFFVYLLRMNTNFWGPALWISLHSITFNYPMKIDSRNKDHQERKKYTKELFENLQYTLPCKYCRESFKEFLKKEPIDKNLSGRGKLTRWLYRVHNLVNAKLRKQEFEAVESKFEELMKDIQSGKKRNAAAMKELEEFAAKTMITEEDPSFEEVCAKYEEQRAKCARPKDSTVVASCRAL